MKTRKYTNFSMLFFIIFSVACSLASPTLFQSKPSGKIIYQSDEFGNFEILMIDIRSNQVSRLTSNSANDVSPTYISALNQIGFISDRKSSMGLYTMDMLGDNQKEVIVDEDIAVEYPDWSSDGKTIVASVMENFDPADDASLFDVYSISVDGKQLTKLTDTPDSEWVPTWSPDGEKIAFASDRDGDSEIYIMNKDGSNLQKLTDNEGYDGGPRWSPNGELISFETDREGGDWDIYIMSVDGREIRPVTENISNDYSQSWSPDGNWLVYVSDNDGDTELFIIDIHGQNQIRLTSNIYNDTSPVWAP